MNQAYEAGAAAGRDIACLAVDCPFPPTDGSGAREAWLSGFSSTRGEVSPASDPGHAEGARQPRRDAPAPHSALHEG